MIEMPKYPDELIKLGEGLIKRGIPANVAVEVVFTIIRLQRYGQTDNPGAGVCMKEAVALKVAVEEGLMGVDLAGAIDDAWEAKFLIDMLEKEDIVRVLSR